MKTLEKLTYNYYSRCVCLERSVSKIIIETSEKSFESKQTNQKLNGKSIIIISNGDNDHINHRPSAELFRGMQISVLAFIDYISMKEQ